MTAEESIRLARKSPAWWLSVFSMILNKRRHLVRPRLNIFQIRMCMAYEWAIRSGRPVRIIGLKPRQVGGSTVSAGIVRHHCESFSTNAVVIADILDRSSKLFKMIRRFQENDRFDWGTEWNWLEKVGASSNGSEIEQKTAENPTASRASTLTALLMSELAFWPQGGAKDAQETITALLNSLAALPNTLAIGESTPKGAYGVFPEMWRDAVWPDFETYWQKWDTRDTNQSKDGTWLRVFSAWWEHIEYSGDPTRPLTKDDTRRIEDTLSERERAGIKLYDWTIAQIAWRRWAIKNNCKGSEVKFDEEYPEDPHRCWQASGSPRFHYLGLAFLRTIGESKTPRVGVLGMVGPQTVFSNDPTAGWCQIWEDPRPGCSYLGVLDSAEDEDVSQSAENVDRDRHSFVLLRKGYCDPSGTWHRPRLVARIRPPCRLPLAIVMEYAELMCRHYGGCLFVPEVNKDGAFVVKEAKRRGMLLYKTRTLDPVTERPLEHAGWRTTPMNRREIVETLAASIRQIQDAEDTTALEIWCPHAIGELSSFVINKDGKAEAAAGCHDDDVMSLAIGYSLIDAATPMALPTVRTVVRDLSGAPVRVTPGGRQRAGGKW